MKTKLTLSIEPDVVRVARQQARMENRSVSSIFSEFIEERQRSRRARAEFELDKVAGSLEGYDIDDSKEGIRKLYAKKYLN